MRGIPALLLLALATLIRPSTARAQTPADLVVLDAVVHTMDPERPRAAALAVAEGRIVAVGSTQEIEAHRGDGTEVIDAGGRAVVPGLIDAHAHVENLGEILRTLDLVGTSGPEEIARLVREAAAGRPPGEWIVGRGWDQNDWSAPERYFPDREILDRAAPENPVFLRRVDGHAVWVNSEALDRAGIDARTADPPGGKILRSGMGRPTGILIDDAEDLVEPFIEPDAREIADRLEAAQEHLVALGLTGVHDMGTKRAELEVYRRWATSERLTIRLVSYLDSDETGFLEEWAAGERNRAGPLRVVGAKLYADGALGSRGAALLEPYSDEPDNRGLLVTDADTLAARAERARRVGLQPAIHAIGDRGNRVALDVLAAVERAVASREERPAPSPPPRIEHAQVIAPEDIPRFAELGVIASVQPTHATSDMYWAEERVGARRIAGAYAWRTLREAGVALACGSDFPVENANPFHGLHAAVTRMDREGWPEGGWRPEERMTRWEALACFTLGAAAAAGMEDEVGSLEVGKRADFAILDRDPMTVPESEIWKVRPVRTMIGGETVYDATDVERGR